MAAKYRYRLTQGGTWMRQDASGQGDEAVCAQQGDTSPSHICGTGGHRYSSACGWCWMNTSHSHAEHLRYIGSDEALAPQDYLALNND